MVSLIKIEETLQKIWKILEKEETNLEERADQASRFNHEIAFHSANSLAAQRLALAIRCPVQNANANRKIEVVQ